MDELDNQLDDLEAGDTTEGGDDSQSQQDGSAEGSSGDSSNSDTSDKRYNDLMSKWQKAEARAQKLEEAASKQGAKPTPSGGLTMDPSVKAWVDAAAASVVERAYESDTRFKEYGIEPSDFKGTTPDEIRAKVRTTKALIDKMETRIRNAILEEHGLTPDVGQTRAQPTKSFDEMSSKEFAEFMESRGFGRR